MSLFMLALMARVLSVQTEELDLKIELVPETTLVVQGKHLLGEVGDTVKVIPQGYIVIQTPSAWDISVSSESGNISIECVADSGPFPASVIVSTSVGNLYLKNPFPTSLTYTSMSGRADIHGQPAQGDWSSSEYNLQSASGRIYISAPVNGVVWVNTLTGVVDIDLSKGVPDRASFDVRTGTGDILVKLPDTTLKNDLSLQKGNFSLKTRRIGMGEYKEQSFFWSWGKLWSPEVLVDYNRVSSVHIGLGLNFSVGSKPSHTASLMGSYSLGQSAFFWRASIRPRLVASPNIFVDFNIFDTISSYDTWGMTRPENAVGALVFKEDARDYFRLKGASFGLDGDVSPMLNLGLRYELLRVYNLSKTTDFSFFGPDEFRDNPQVDTGSLRAVVVGVDYHNRGFAVQGEFAKSLSDSFGLNQVKTSITGKREGWSYLLLGRLCLGYAFQDHETGTSPFAFHIGGIGTVPAYPYRYITASRALLFNGEYHMKLRGLGPLRRLIGFVDAGTGWNQSISGDSIMVDIGAGLSVYGISLRVAQDIVDLGRSPVLFMRLEQRF